MTECVLAVGAVGGVAAVFVKQAFSYDDQAVLVLLENALSSSMNFPSRKEVPAGKSSAGRHAGSPPLGQGRAGGNPPCVSSHDLDNRNEVMLPHGLMIKSGFLDDRTEVLDHAPVSQAMIRGDQVVVDRLGNPDHSQCIILLLGKLRNLVSGILRIIPAGVEEIADVVSFENLMIRS